MSANTGARIYGILCLVSWDIEKDVAIMMMVESAKDHLLHELFCEQTELSIDGIASGAENMRRDEERAQTLLLQPLDDTIYLRLYAWQPWAVSLGANQKATDIDEALLQAKAFDLVRRVTGGRAVLHADELTYSIVMRIPPSVTIHDIYRVSHEFLLRGLRQLDAQGIRGEALVFERSQPQFARLYREQPNTVSCFASSARYEIMYNGKKVVGSAQRVFGDVLLQHGSILVGEGHEQLADVVSNRDEQQREDMRRYIVEHSATLSEVFARTIKVQECAEAIARSWKEPIIEKAG